MRFLISSLAILAATLTLGACSSEHSNEQTASPETTASSSTQSEAINKEESSKKAEREFRELRAQALLHPCDADFDRLDALWSEMDENYSGTFLSLNSNYQKDIEKACKNQNEGKTPHTRDQQQPHPAKPAPFNAQAEAPPHPAPSVTDPKHEWKLLGPFASLNTCEQNAGRQPLHASACFTLSDGNAYFWSVVQRRINKR